MAKAIGIIRRVDELGRVVIPKELRRVRNINEGDPLEIFIDDEGEIILKKYQPGCLICGELDNLKTIKGARICACCAMEIWVEFNSLNNPTG